MTNALQKAFCKLDKTNANRASELAKLRTDSIYAVVTAAVGSGEARDHELIVKAINEGALSRTEAETFHQVSTEILALQKQADQAHDLCKWAAEEVERQTKIRREAMEATHRAIAAINRAEEKRAVAFAPHQRLKEIFAAFPEVASILGNEPAKQASDTAIENGSGVVAMVSVDQEPGEMKEQKGIYPGWIG